MPGEKQIDATLLVQGAKGQGAKGLEGLEGSNRIRE
jgi:hypothetical protein